MFSKLNVASDLSKIGKFLMEVEGNCVAWTSLLLPERSPTR